MRSDPFVTVEYICGLNRRKCGSQAESKRRQLVRSHAFMHSSFSSSVEALYKHSSFGVEGLPASSPACLSTSTVLHIGARLRFSAEAI